MALTLKIVERLKSKPGRHSDGLGLYLQVASPSAASWTFRYQRNGKERWRGIGSLNTFSLPEARERARKLRQQLADGGDLEARKTFRECVEAYFNDNADRWSNAKHRAQFLSTLRTYAYPILGELSVADIGVAKVLAVFEQPMEGTTFWKARTETASRVRSRIETVLGWATVRGFRKGDNPARWDGFLSTQLARRGKKRPHPALPFDALPAFIADLRKREAVAAKALEFLILCTARTGAVIGAQWDEIDWPGKTWNVPPDRAGTKIYGDAPRRVPLSDRAIEILKEVPREGSNPFIFIGGREGAGMANDAMAVLINRTNAERKRNKLPRYTDPKLGNADITVHGFRSTFKDWCSERTNYPNHISEAALWHVVADKVEAAYRRGDLFEKRRRLMADWARYCSSPASGEVIEMRAAR